MATENDDTTTGTTATEEDPTLVNSTAVFTPVISLPEIVVRTNEEEEDIFSKTRAKLFVFGETLLNVGSGKKEWKERGVGEIKVLRDMHNRTSFRLLMRQERTLRVICNCTIGAHITMSPNVGSDRSWVWTANDFSEGKYELCVFAAKFGSVESAQDFKTKFEEAKAIAVTTPAAVSVAVPVVAQEAKSAAEDGKLAQELTSLSVSSSSST